MRRHKKIRSNLHMGGTIPNNLQGDHRKLSIINCLMFLVKSNLNTLIGGILALIPRYIMVFFYVLLKLPPVRLVWRRKKNSSWAALESKSISGLVKVGSKVSSNLVLLRENKLELSSAKLSSLS